MLFSLKAITLPRAEISRLRARPKGFPIALWKPSGPSSCCYTFNTAQYQASPRKRAANHCVCALFGRKSPPVFPAGFRFSLQKGDSLQIVHTQTQIYSYLPRIIKASKEQKPFDPPFSISNKISYFLYSFLFSNSKMQKLLRSTAGRGSFCFYCVFPHGFLL